MFTIFFVDFFFFFFPAGSHPVCHSTPYWMSWMTTQVSERSLLRTWGTKCMGSWWGTHRTWRERENMWVPNTYTWDPCTLWWSSIQVVFEILLCLVWSTASPGGTEDSTVSRPVLETHGQRESFWDLRCQKYWYFATENITDNYVCNRWDKIIILINYFC